MKEESGRVIHLYTKSVEVFVPSINKSCTLRSLPDTVFDHTQNGLTQCGGLGSEHACHKFSQGLWSTTYNLTKERVGHSSWQTDNGLILMGGAGSETTTEMFTEGQFSPGFDLKYNIRFFVLSSI